MFSRLQERAEGPEKEFNSPLAGIQETASRLSDARLFHFPAIFPSDRFCGLFFAGFNLLCFSCFLSTFLRGGFG